MKDLAKIEARDEHSIVIGNLNKHLSLWNVKCDDVTEENHGGKLLKEFLIKSEYILVNDTDKSIGGPNTRYSPEDPNNE